MNARIQAAKLLLHDARQVLDELNAEHSRRLSRNLDRFERGALDVLPFDTNPVARVRLNDAGEIIVTAPVPLGWAQSAALIVALCRATRRARAIEVERNSEKARYETA